MKKMHGWILVATSGLTFCASKGYTDSVFTSICGKVESLNRQGRPTVNLVDLQSEAEPRRYQVTNPDSWRWHKGSCTCVTGVVPDSADQIAVTAVQSIDETGRDCLPIFFP